MQCGSSWKSCRSVSFLTLTFLLQPKPYHSQYLTFLDHAMWVFLIILQDSSYFIYLSLSSSLITCHITIRSTKPPLAFWVFLLGRKLSHSVSSLTPILYWLFKSFISFFLYVCFNLAQPAGVDANSLSFSLSLSLSGFFKDGTSHFIAELHIQQVRKLVLEMIQRLPANDLLKPYVKNILSLTFKLLGKHTLVFTVYILSRK